MGQSFNAQKGVTGDLLQWSAKTGWQAVPGSQRPGWNGIVVAKDGSRLDASAWPDRQVLECIFGRRSEEHTSERQSLMRISYAVIRSTKIPVTTKIKSAE